MRRSWAKFVLSFLAGNLNFYMLYKLKSTKRTADDKDKKYLQLFDKWMILIENGDAIERFFVENNIKEIAVYGYGNIGKHLISQLSDTVIKYVIDKRKDSIITEKIPCYQVSKDMPEVDAIIVTPIYEYAEINNILKEFTSAEILSMEDIIYELL